MQYTSIIVVAIIIALSVCTAVAVVLSLIGTKVFAIKVTGVDDKENKLNITGDYKSSNECKELKFVSEKHYAIGTNVLVAVDFGKDNSAREITVKGVWSLSIAMIFMSILQLSYVFVYSNFLIVCSVCSFVTLSAAALYVVRTFKKMTNAIYELAAV